jgi:hypothetical protein
LANPAGGETDTAEARDMHQPQAPQPSQAVTPKASKAAVPKAPQHKAPPPGQTSLSIALGKASAKK